MADFNSSLPIRTESAGDAAVKIVDATITSQGLAIDASGQITSKVVDSAGNSIDALSAAPTGTENGLVVRNIPSGTQAVSGTVAATQSGTWDMQLQDGAGNPITSQASGGQQALDVGINVAGVQVDPRAIRALTSADVVTAQMQDGSGNALTSTTGGGKTMLDQILRDASGVALGTVTNPLAVAISADVSGDDIVDFNTSAAVAGGASSNHDYTVSGGKTLLFNQVEASGSGKIKVEIQVETGVGSNTFVTKAVQFNSTSAPNTSIKFGPPISVAAGVRVRVIRTNRDNQAQDVYSTLMGQEV